jgi:hypothetical protein
MNRINDVLVHIPVGTPQTTVVALLIATLGHSHSNVIFTNLLKSRVLFSSIPNQIANLKDIGTYVRKCASDLNLQSLTNPEVGALAYYDLTYGRSLFTSNWQDEINNRCLGTVHLQSPEIQFSSRGEAEWLSDVHALQIRKKPRTDNFYPILREHLNNSAKKTHHQKEYKGRLQNFLLTSP